LFYFKIVFFFIVSIKKGSGLSQIFTSNTRKGTGKKSDLKHPMYLSVCFSLTSYFSFDILYPENLIFSNAQGNLV